MKILIAEDDDITRPLLSSVLTRLGHDVRATTNGREAWDAWRTGDYQFVVTDWMMPVLDGLEFCRRVRAEQRTGYTFIILLTSRYGKTDYSNAMSAGIDDFITKPFEKDELAARIRIGERILSLHGRLSAANADLDRRVMERMAVLESALKARNELISSASHDLRTPIIHILSSAQHLESEPLETRQRDCVAQILASGTHVMALIERILTISDLRAGELELFEPGTLGPQRPGAA